MSFADGDPVEQIRELRRRRGLPIGEEEKDGVQNGIDVGFGRTHDRRYTTSLRDLVVAGRTG